MKLNDKFVSYEEKGSVMMVSTDTKRFSGIVKGNKTTADVIALLKNDITRDELVAKMLDKYEGDPEKIAADVDRVIETFRKINAIDD